MNRWDGVTLADRFWPKVAITGPDECWVWQAATMARGYGKILFHGRLIGAHRASWILAHGDPGEMFVLHRCDNPPCVNPAHLWLGTNLDNHRDCCAKGRQAKGIAVRPKNPASGDRHWQRRHPDLVRRGEAVNFAKLTADQVIAIRGDGRFHREIAASYGVSRSLIGFIKIGKGWKHVPVAKCGM